MKRCRCLLTLLLAGACVCLTAPVARAAGNQPAGRQAKPAAAAGEGQELVRSYMSQKDLQPGSWVRLARPAASSQKPGKESGQNGQVVPADAKHAAQVLGAVVAPGDAPLTLTEATSRPHVLVATRGNYQVLVSDQNGAVRPGDYLALSAISGIAMKAGAHSKVTVGKAISGFDGRRQVVGSSSISRGGQKSSVRFGYVNAILNVGPNPLHRPKSSTAKVPEFLAKASSALTHKHISPARIYLSLAVLFATAVILIGLLYAGVRTSILALGRNPMAKKTIMRGLLQVVLTAIIVLIIGLFAVYLLLKL
jgi:hypothetical protein